MDDDSRRMHSRNEAKDGHSVNFPPAVEVREIEVIPRADRRRFQIHLIDHYGRQDCLCFLSRSLIQELRKQIDAAL